MINGTRRRPLAASWHSILVPWFHPASHMLHPEPSGIQELQVEGSHRRCLGKVMVVESWGMLTYYDFLVPGVGQEVEKSMGKWNNILGNQLNMLHAFVRKEQSFGQHVQIPLGE